VSGLLLHSRARLLVKNVGTITMYRLDRRILDAACDPQSKKVLVGGCSSTWEVMPKFKRTNSPPSESRHRCMTKQGMLVFSPKVSDLDPKVEPLSVSSFSSTSIPLYNSIYSPTQQK
jgi:hypothetical protein